MTEIPTSNFEKSPIPKEREVIKLIEGLIGERPYTEVIRREDEEGLYRLVIEVVGDDGDPIRYDYIRAGQFPEGNPSETAIDIIYLNSDGDEVEGDCAAKYINGTWQTQNGLPNMVEDILEHEDDIDQSEGMRILLAKKYNLPETVTFDEILDAEEKSHSRKMTILLGLPEEADYETIRRVALDSGNTFLDVNLWATHGTGLNPTKQEFEMAVLNTRLEREKLLREASELTKSLKANPAN